MEYQWVSYVKDLWCTKCRFWRRGQDFMKNRLQHWILHHCIHLLWWPITYVTALWWFSALFLFATMSFFFWKLGYKIISNVEALWSKIYLLWSLWRWRLRMFENSTFPQNASTKPHLVKHLLNQTYRRLGLCYHMHTYNGRHD